MRLAEASFIVEADGSVVVVVTEDGVETEAAFFRGVVAVAVAVAVVVAVTGGIAVAGEFTGAVPTFFDATADVVANRDTAMLDADPDPGPIDNDSVAVTGGDPDPVPVDFAAVPVVKLAITAANDAFSVTGCDPDDSNTDPALLDSAAVPSFDFFVGRFCFCFFVSADDSGALV